MSLKSITKEFTGYDSIFSFNCPGAVYHFHADIHLECDEVDLLRGKVKVRKPIKVTWRMGRSVPTDVIWTTLIIPLISARVANIFNEHGFTGWSTYPVEVYGKKGELIKGYSGLSILGRCGKIDPTKSVKIKREFPAGFYDAYKGLYYDESKWDGSDIFMPQDNTSWMFITKKVKDVIKKEKIRNVDMTPLSDIIQDEL